MTVKTVSASIMRVSLTDVIADLPSYGAVGITKRKDIIGYVLSPEAYEALTAYQQEAAAEDTSVEEEAPEVPVEASEDDVVVDLDAARAAYSQLDDPSEEGYDEDDDIFEEEDDSDFDRYLDNLRTKTMGLGFLKV